MNTQKLRDMNLHAVADELEQLRAFKAEIESQRPIFYSVHRKENEPSNAVCFDDIEAANKYVNTNYNLCVSGLYAKPVPADKPAVAVPDEISSPEPDAENDSLYDHGFRDGWNSFRDRMLASSPSHSQQSADAVKAFCKYIGLYDPEYDDQGYIEVSRYKLKEHVESLYDRCPSHESEQGVSDGR